MKNNSANLILSRVVILELARLEPWLYFTIYQSHQLFTFVNHEGFPLIRAFLPAEPYITKVTHIRDPICWQKVRWPLTQMKHSGKIQKMLKIFCFFAAINAKCLRRLLVRLMLGLYCSFFCYFGQEIEGKRLLSNQREVYHMGPNIC
jgi:hypothetical protein